MSIEDTHNRKNGKARAIPIVETVADQPANHDARKLPEQAHGELNRLFARISQAKEQLGALYFQRAAVEAQALAIVGKLASDDNEAKTLLDAAAKQLGIANEPGWGFDLQSGEFRRVK